MEVLKKYVHKKKVGLWQEVGIPARGLKLHQAIDKGLSYDVYVKISKATGIGKSEVAKATVIAPSTLRRRAQTGRFSKEESDRLYRFAEVFGASVKLFGNDREAAKQWLHSPVKGLGNNKPIEMLSTGAETEAVLNLIGRLEHGVFS